MTNIFNSIPEKIERYFYIFADLDIMPQDSLDVPIYEMKVELDYNMVDTINDCFNKCITLNHVANMLVSTEIHGEIFTYLTASVNSRVLNFTTVKIFLRQNGQLQIPYDVRESTRRGRI